MSVRVGYRNPPNLPWVAEHRIPCKDEFIRDQVARLRALRAPKHGVRASCPCGWRSRPQTRDAAVADLYDHALSHDFA